MYIYVYVQVLEVMQKLRKNQLKILFVSPEKMVTPGFQRFLKTIPKPGVSFVCIDEGSHSPIPYSHSFRFLLIICNLCLSSLLLSFLI